MERIINILWFILFFVLMLLCVQGFGATAGMISAVVVSLITGIIVPVFTRDKNNINEP